MPRGGELHLLQDRLTEELGRRTDYELECPNGGVAVAMGNAIQQSAQTENEIMISCGAEGYKWPASPLVLGPARHPGALQRLVDR